MTGTTVDVGLIQADIANPFYTSFLATRQRVAWWCPSVLAGAEQVLQGELLQAHEAVAIGAEVGIRCVVLVAAAVGE